MERMHESDRRASRVSALRTDLIRSGLMPVAWLSLAVMAPASVLPVHPSGSGTEYLISATERGHQRSLDAARRGELDLEQLLQRLLEESGSPLPAVRELPDLRSVRSLLRSLADLAEEGLPVLEEGEQRERSVELVLTIVGRYGTHDGVERILRIAAPSSPDRRPSPRVETAFVDGLRELLGRNELASGRLGDLLLEHPRGLWSPALRALGSQEGPAADAALSALLELHGASSWLDPALLVQARQLAASRPAHRCEDRELSRLRDSLRARASSQTLGERCLLLAALGDHGALFPLLELMEHEEATVRSTAWHALRDLTGLGLREDPEVWNRWASRELEWWDSRSTELEHMLFDGNSSEQLLAVRELGQHRLPHAPLAENLRWALHHADESAAAQAALHLGRMGARSAIPDLQSARLGRSSRLCHAAAAALSQLGAADDTL